jgi:hypothetical protein
MATRYAILLITAFGMVGGFINAFLTDQGLTLPSLDQLRNGQKILRPGFAGNVIVGGVTAIILAGLYSPLGAVEIGTRTAPNLHLTIGSLAAALLSAIEGARLLTQEVENRYTELKNKRLASGLKDLVPTEDSPKDEGG